MSRSAARFTQAELARAARVARDNGWRVEIADGVIRLVEGPEPATQRATPLAPKPEIRL